MPTYKVSRLLKTQVRFLAPCDIGAFTFVPIGDDTDREAVASSVLSASDYKHATKLFDDALLPTADAISVVTGAAFSLIGASTLVEKPRGGKYVYLHAILRRPASHLSVHPAYHPAVVEQSTMLASVLKHDKRLRAASNYLRHGATTENLLTATFSALQAADALATRSAGSGTNKALRQRLVGDDLHA